MCIIGGQVQTGSVFLQAAPEEYRCKNEMDYKFGAEYELHAFASTENQCKKWDVDWEQECPGLNSAEDYETCFIEKELDSSCTTCSEYVYSPNNTFTETVVGCPRQKLPSFLTLVSNQVKTID